MRWPTWYTQPRSPTRETGAFLPGSGYLAYGGILELASLRPTILLAATALTGILLAATLIAAMASPSISPEHIRTD